VQLPDPSPKVGLHIGGERRSRRGCHSGQIDPVDRDPDMVQHSDAGCISQ
jgi:hypothetical protein